MLRHDILFWLCLVAIWPASTQAQHANSTCERRVQHLADPPYQNYFYSDCHVDAQAVVTSPLPDSNLTIISPRLIVAWPAGNSGICTFFRPQNGVNGSLAIGLNSIVGVEGVFSFNDSAELSLSILGSIRNIRDFTEGPSMLSPVIQRGIKVTKFNESGVRISRMWLDNVTTTTLTLTPWSKVNGTIRIGHNSSISFDAGLYHFSASYNYPQLTQLAPCKFSTIKKLLAGGWRFLTYFGRDSMITAFLLQPVLSPGKSSAIEAVLGSALEGHRLSPLPLELDR
ncbi:putative lipoprotein [Hirsutella rhossiliensis]